jgi:uncharacterized protein YqjF (DUF2071 family)
MHQSWGKLLFMHWQVPAEVLRPFIPERLTIDTFESQTWIGVTPFTVWDARPVFTPPLPWLSEFHEINVRTYVHLDGVPGVWFFSLDAYSKLAVTAARTLFHLPYYNASINLEQQGDTIIYTSSREEEMPPADFKAVWTIGPALPKATPGSLEFFLLERYCLYTANAGKLYRCRIFHQPWPLWEAQFSTYRSSMIEGDGLPAPAGEPLLHCGGPVSVDVWPLEEV